MSKDVTKIVTLTRNNCDSRDSIRERRFRPSLMFPVDGEEQSDARVGGAIVVDASPNRTDLRCATDIAVTAYPLTLSEPNAQAIDTHDSKNSVHTE